jgi:hypothetical protein
MFRTCLLMLATFSTSFGAPMTDVPWIRCSIPTFWRGDALDGAACPQALSLTPADGDKVR